MRSLQRLASAGVALSLCACANADAVPTATSADATAPPSTRAREPATLAPSASRTVGDLYVSSSGLWSIVVPPGWKLEAELESAAAFTRGNTIAEVLVSPSSGLTSEELEAEVLDFLSTWPGAADVESDFVRLPAGEALRATMVFGGPPGPRSRFISYTLLEAETRYVVSVRGRDNGNLLTAAEALAESFSVLE